MRCIRISISIRRSLPLNRIRESDRAAGGSVTVADAVSALGVVPGDRVLLAQQQAGPAFHAPYVVVVDAAAAIGREAAGRAKLEARVRPAIAALVSIHDDVGRVVDGVLQRLEAFGDGHVPEDSLSGLGVGLERASAPA